MFSGKTDELKVKALTFCALKGYRIVSINSKTDIREENVSKVGNLTTHSRVKMELPKEITQIYSGRSLYASVDPSEFDVFLLDECQQYDDLVTTVSFWVNYYNKIVYCAGLDGDYNRKPFGKILHLIPQADHVTRFKSVCLDCREEYGTHTPNAPFSFYKGKRLTQAETQIGGNELYVALCRKHFNEKELESKSYDQTQYVVGQHASDDNIPFLDISDEQVENHPPPPPPNTIDEEDTVKEFKKNTNNYDIPFDLVSSSSLKTKQEEKEKEKEKEKEEKEEKEEISKTKVWNKILSKRERLNIQNFKASIDLLEKQFSATNVNLLEQKTLKVDLETPKTSIAIKDVNQDKEKKDKQTKTKVYLAGKYKESSDIYNKMNELKTKGYSITFDWTRNVEKRKNSPETFNVPDSAESDLEGVRTCDIFIALLTDKDYAYRGTSTELGAALILEKKIYVVCPKINTEIQHNVFLHHKLVTQFENWESLLETL
jgi:thymidine kinase